MEHIIYGLIDPSDSAKRVRYIGYSSKGISKRLIQHLTEAKAKRANHRHHWLNAVAKRGDRPEIVVLETVTAESWQERERFWIAQFEGLVNSTTGGEGLINPPLDVRARIAAKVSIALAGNSYRKGIPHGAEDRAKISASLMASESFQVAHRARRGISKPPMKEETKEKVRQAKLGKAHPRTPEWNAKLVAARAGQFWATDGANERYLKSGEAIPEGWHRGRSPRMADGQRGNQRGLGKVKPASARAALVSAKTGSKIITDGTNRKFLKPGETLPEGWRFVHKPASNPKGA